MQKRRPDNKYLTILLQCKNYVAYFKLDIYKNIVMLCVPRVKKLAHILQQITKHFINKQIFIF